MSSEWNHPYSREEAAFPLPWILPRGKYWAPIGRNDDSYGDVNFLCTIKEIIYNNYFNSESLIILNVYIIILHCQ